MYSGWYSPEIKYLAQENINFSQNDKIGGRVQLNGTGWTIAGIVSQYSGVPLMLPFIDGNNYGILGDKFMPGAYGIGDILNKAGYKNYFILGSEAEFGGRDKYFKTLRLVHITIYEKKESKIMIEYLSDEITQIAFCFLIIK